MGAFDIIKMETRVSRMIAWMAAIQKKITDFAPGSKARTKLEAIGLELEQMDFQIYQAVKKAIAISTYNAFGITPLPATRASGIATFSGPIAVADILIPAGTRITTTATATLPAKVYETKTDVTLTTGTSTVTATVIAIAAGEAGNTAPGSINTIKTTIGGIDAVTNIAALSNGTDRESEASRAIRFKEYIASLGRGTTAAVVYGAKLASIKDAEGNITESVKNAVAIDNPKATAGFVDVFIYNGVGGTSVDLVAGAQKIVDGYIDTDGEKIPGYKAAGIVATVAAVTENPLDVTFLISMLPGYDATAIEAAAESAIATYIAGMGIGATVVLNEMIERIMAIDGVYDVDISAPTGNVPASEIVATTYLGTIGLDDLTSGGVFSGEGKKTFLVEIDSVGAQDTFRWSLTEGATWNASLQPITAGTPVELETGTTIAFAAQTGHTSGDQWTIDVSAAIIITPGTIAATVQ